MADLELWVTATAQHQESTVPQIFPGERSIFQSQAQVQVRVTFMSWSIGTNSTLFRRQTVHCSFMTPGKHLGHLGSLLIPPAGSLLDFEGPRLHEEDSLGAESGPLIRKTMPFHKADG